MCAPTTASHRSFTYKTPPTGRAARLQRAAEQARGGGSKDGFASALADYVRAAARREKNRSGAYAEADIDDVVQDLTLRFYAELPLWDPTRAPFSGFISQALRWALLDASRRFRSRGPLVDPDADLVREQAGIDLDPEALLERARKDAVIDARIAALPRALRSIRDSQARKVIERTVAGARLSDVAAELGVHVSTACRARQRGFLEVVATLQAA